MTLMWEDLGYLVLGVIFLTMGLVTLLLTVLRAATRHLSIFLFGAMSLVWGLRFLIYTDLFQLAWPTAAGAIPLVARSLTFFGGAAAFGFGWAYFGPGWRRTLKWLTWLSLGFALIGTVVLAFHDDRDLLLPIFNVIIVGGALLVVFNLLVPPLRRASQTRGLLGGVAVAAVFFILENLRALGLLSIDFPLEWIGVLVLYLALGRMIAIKLFTSEARLAAVQQELETARLIQASLLPRNPELAAGLGVTARYLPMTEVAGDIYDVVKAGPHQQGILVADVSGHGVPAAMIASMVKGAFRAELENLPQPEKVLAGMNKILTGQLGTQFVTAACLFIDSGKGALRYAGAGHPPLLIRDGESGKCRQLQRNGLMLGQFAEAEYRRAEEVLNPGDRVLLYTDGITEATSPDDVVFGEQALQEFLEIHGRLPADQMLDSLLSVVAKWAALGPQKDPEDDQTMVLVDVVGP